MQANEKMNSKFLHTITSFLEEDQRLMNSLNWNYLDPDSSLNKLKAEIEGQDPDRLTFEEKEARQDALWMWYHHATSKALSLKDRTAAQAFAQKACTYHSSHNPNRITQLLYFLAFDMPQEAKEWAEKIPNPTEYDTAQLLLSQYLDDSKF